MKIKNKDILLVYLSDYQVHVHYVTFTVFSYQCLKSNYNVPVVTFHTCFGNVFFQFCNHGKKSTRDLLQQFV